MISPRTLLLCLIAAAFVAPGAAGAATFCVNAPGSTPCDSVQPDLQTALNAAATAGGPDTVALGSNDATHSGPFVYPNGQITIENKVTIKGVGPARPVLTAPAGATVLTLSNASVEGVDISLPSSGSGVGIRASGGSLRDVHVVGPGAADASGAIGVDAIGDLTLADLDITGTGAFGLSVSAGHSSGSDVHIADVRSGVGTGETAGLDLTRSKVAAHRYAFISGGDSSVSASVLQTTDPDGDGVWAQGGPLALDHDTIVHRGASGGTDVGLDVAPVDFGGEVTMSSVVVAGYAHGISRDTSEFDASFPITVRDSVWDNAHDVFISAGQVSAFEDLGNAHVDPKLVDVAGGDLRLRGSSAAIDRDTRTDLRYTDVDGAGLVDGDANGTELADAGALEYRRGAPTVDSANVPGSGATGQSLDFAASPSDPDGDTVTAAWDFGDGSIGAGTQAAHAYAAPGIYTVTLHVTDETGLGAKRSFSVAVSGAAAGGAAGAAGTTGAGGAGADVVAPKLSKVSLSKSKLSKSRLRARSAKAPALRFTLSERATVRITIGGAKLVRTLAPGRHALGLTNTLRKAKRLPLGRAAIKLTATDPAGNRAIPRTVKLKIVA